MPEERDMDFIDKPITCESDAQAFLYQLNELGMTFHPEDDPSSVIAAGTGEPLFSPEVAPVIRMRMDEVHQYMDDPCQYILELIGPVGDEARSNGPRI